MWSQLDELCLLRDDRRFVEAISRNEALNLQMQLVSQAQIINFARYDAGFNKIYLSDAC